MDLLTLIRFLIGLGLLIGGAELLVRGAARLAVAAGISPLVVGLTVVAYGTSAPELAVTLQSVFQDPPAPDLALGNVVGSNISNILLVLGISSLLCPLVVSRQIVRYTLPLMIAVSVLVLLLSGNGSLGRLEGGLLFLGAILYTVLEVGISRRQWKQEPDQNASRPSPSRGRVLAQGVLCVGLVVAGLLLLLQGADWLVEGATQFARWLGADELVIGLTVVAVGTSLPEIATSIVAGVRGQRDIAVGNVVGSNIFNILLVLGLTAFASPQGLPVSPEALRTDIPIMLLASLACLPVFWTEYQISRWEGGLLLVSYALYCGYLFLSQTNPEALAIYARLLLFGLAPLVLGVLAWSMVRHWRRSAQRPLATEQNPSE